MNDRRKGEPTFSTLREVGLGLGIYAVYLLVRRAVVDAEGERRALDNARRVAALEERVGVHVEPQLQQPMLAHPRALHVLGIAYGIANAGLTVGWLIRLFRRRDPSFHEFRTATALTALAAQPIYWAFPCAPPRKLDHVVDTILDVTGIDLESGPVGRLYNPIAAMPSIHVAFAVLTAEGVRRCSPSRWRRAAARVYAPLVAYTVFVTGNHFVADALVGALIGRAALWTARRLHRGE